MPFTGPTGLPGRYPSPMPFAACERVGLSLQNVHGIAQALLMRVVPAAAFTPPGTSRSYHLHLTIPC